MSESGIFHHAQRGGTTDYLLLAVFAGTVFYKQLRAFFAGGWLK